MASRHLELGDDGRVKQQPMPLLLLIDSKEMRRVMLIQVKTTRRIGWASRNGSILTVLVLHRHLGSAKLYR